MRKFLTFMPFLVIGFLLSLAFFTPVKQGITFDKPVPLAEIMNDLPTGGQEILVNLTTDAPVSKRNGAGVTITDQDYAEVERMYWTLIGFSEGQEFPEKGCAERGDCPTLLVRYVSGYGLPGELGKSEPVEEPGGLRFFAFR